IPGTRCASSALRPISWASAAADQRCDTIAQGMIGLFMREEMDVRVDSARRRDEPLTRNGFCPCANHQVGVNIIHCKGVARLADACDLTIFNANVSFDDADHGVHYTSI